MFMRNAVLACLAILCAVGNAPSASAQYRDRNDYYNQRRDKYQDDYDDNGDRFDNSRNVAGKFDYYALVLSWSPTHCSETDGDDLQCNRRDGRRYNFVLHGLWPQYERGYPQDCRSARRPFVPQPLIDNMLDIMPSQRLVIHEFRKHGVCSGLSADAYFSLARRLFTSIRVPEEFKNPLEQQTIEPRQLANALIRANPGLKPENFGIACNGQGNKLQEIRICFSKEGALRPCGRNEDQRRLCSASRIFVPPVRSTARDDVSAPARRYESPVQRSSPLPGPRDNRY